MGLGIVHGDNFWVRLAERVSQLGKPLLRQFLQHQLGPFRWVLGRLEFLVKCILAGSCPVENICKGPRYRPRLNGLIDGL